MVSVKKECNFGPAKEKFILLKISLATYVLGLIIV